MDPDGVVQLHNAAAVRAPGPRAHRDRAGALAAADARGSRPSPTPSTATAPRKASACWRCSSRDVQYAGADGIVAIARDVTTEQRRIEELTSFAAVAAHDLKSPLAAVQGWIEVAEDALDNDTDHRRRRPSSAGAVPRTGCRARSTTGSPTTWPARGRCSPRPWRCSRSLDSIVATYPGGDFLVETPDSVRADPTLLRHLLVNLVGNAVKYTRPGEKPIVTIRSFATKDRNWVRIYVVDAGIGIPEGEESDDLRAVPPRRRRGRHLRRLGARARPGQADRPAARRDDQRRAQRGPRQHLHGHAPPRLSASSRVLERTPVPRKTGHSATRDPYALTQGMGETCDRVEAAPTAPPHSGEGAAAAFSGRRCSRSSCSPPPATWSAPYVGLDSRDVDPRIAEVWPPGGVGFVLLTTVWLVGRRAIARDDGLHAGHLRDHGRADGATTSRRRSWMGLLAVTQSALMVWLYRRSLRPSRLGPGVAPGHRRPALLRRRRPRCSSGSWAASRSSTPATRSPGCWSGGCCATRCSASSARRRSW